MIQPIWRAAQLCLALLCATVAIWSITYFLPGDPASVLLGPNATPESIRAERVRLSLDEPIFSQYLAWLKNVLQGDLGISFSSRGEVRQLIVSRLMPSLQLIGASVALGAAISVPVALGQVRGPRLVRQFAGIYSGLALSIPTFWIGLLLILVLSVQWSVFPATASYIPVYEDPVGMLRATALPVLTLGLFCSGVFSRFLRASLEEQYDSDHVRTARAKGLSRWRIAGAHALYNSLPEFITVAGLQISAFVGGAVITEQVFNYPGLGRLLLVAVSRRDYPLLQGCLLFIVIVVILANALADTLRRRVDPRTGGRN